MNESQRRAFAALGIGPLWQRRGASRTEPALSTDAESRELFLLPDDTGGWLFVGEAGHFDPHPPDSMRLLERMLVALGLRPAEALHVPFVAQRERQDSEGTGADAEAALAERIDTIAPRIVVALGADAAHALLRTDAPPASLRGRVHESAIGLRRVPVVVSWPPSQLLAAPQDKASAWADLCLARDVVEAAVNGRREPGVGA